MGHFNTQNITKFDTVSEIYFDYIDKEKAMQLVFFGINMGK